MTYICCSHCKRDLTHSGGSYDHSLILSDRKFGPPDGWPVFDIFILPIIEKDHHFCGLGCLVAWANFQYIEQYKKLKIENEK